MWLTILMDKQLTLYRKFIGSS